MFPTINARILFLRRLTLLIPASILAFTGIVLAWNMSAPLPGDSRTVIDLLSFAVFSLLFSMLSVTSWAMMLGLILWFSGRRRVELENEAAQIPLSELVPSKNTRTALLIPAYHEDPHEVFARVRTMQHSLAALQPRGTESDIDIFVLSDSQNPSAIEAEDIAYKATLGKLAKNGPTVFYRRRTDNSEYKVGNIKEFCTHWGKAYDHMLVLDADSLMAGETIRRMIRLMERHPRIGLLQTCFIPIGRDTLFCRIMQFSTRLYLMPSAMGLEFWQGANGNFWGHNALIRTRAFTESCGLPVLPGKAPLGGRILSHDIVEAAFIGRGGWEAWLLPNMEGTYEELPTNLIDFMQRDRRWCAGNLQHQHIMRADNIPFGNRLHMGLGIMSYATGPLWLLFVMLAFIGTVFSTDSASLKLATAGLMDETAAGNALLYLTLVMLFVPKLITLSLAMLQSKIRKSFGGGFKLLASAVLEQIFTMLQQPAVMLFYTTFVIMPLCGNVVRWEAQPRSERGISWKEAFLRHRKHLLLAIILTSSILAFDKLTQAIGLLPVLIGLFAAPAFTVLTSRASLGQLTRRWGLFLTVDELNPAPEVKTLQTYIAEPKATKPGKVKVPALPQAAPTAMEPQPLHYPPRMYPVVSSVSTVQYAFEEVRAERIV